MPDWHFVRHGQSLANHEGWFAGTHDVDLTDLGVEQARTARADFDEIVVHRAFASDLRRAHRTAEILLAGRDIPLTVTDQLRERCCGDWECRIISEIEAAGEIDVFLGWQTRPPGGESLEDVAIRALRWLSRVDDGTSHTLVVAHGALIRAVIGAFDGLPRDRIGLWRPKNCEIVTRTVAPGQWAALLEELERNARAPLTPS